MNLVFSYGVTKDNEYVAMGFRFLGAGLDEKGTEVHVFEVRALLKCPKCGKTMRQIADKGDGKGPNGGTLRVVETKRGKNIRFDSHVEGWKCFPCGTCLYVSEGT